jgi:hypothetical protein
VTEKTNGVLVHRGKPDARACRARSCYNVGRSKKNREDAMPHTLVASDRVEHANVYGLDGTKLGTIERLMLDKVSGTVAYAVIKTGGLLASHHHYPVRWDALRFDPARQAFMVELALDDLRAGPSELDDDAFDWGDRSRPHPHYWSV